MICHLYWSSILAPRYHAEKYNTVMSPPSSCSPQLKKHWNFVGTFFLSEAYFSKLPSPWHERRLWLKLPFLTMTRCQIWCTIPKKTDHSIAIYSIFCIGMVYFGCLQVNPHIQAVQNMCEEKEIGINNSMYLQFTEQYRMAKGLC